MHVARSFAARHPAARRRRCWRCVGHRDQAPRHQRGVQPGHLHRRLRADGAGHRPTARCSPGTASSSSIALNVFLVTLTAFVGLTTAIFSRPYMRVERDHGKMTPPRLRLYHSMYQLFSFTMLLALTTNNMGILWVAMEAATLTTVLLVSVYRTAASLEAAWKYFILCGVGIAQALFGTVLLYMAAEKVLGSEGGALLWTHLDAVKGQLDPQHHHAGLRLPVHRLRHQGRPGAAAQLAARCARRRPDAGVGGAVRPAAQRGAVRGAALQGADRRRAAKPAGRPPDDGLRPAVGGGGGVLADRGRRTSSACSPIRRSSTWA